MPVQIGDRVRVMDTRAQKRFDIDPKYNPAKQGWTGEVLACSDNNCLVRFDECCIEENPLAAAYLHNASARTAPCPPPDRQGRRWWCAPEWLTVIESEGSATGDLDDWEQLLGEEAAQ